MEASRTTYRNCEMIPRAGDIVTINDRYKTHYRLVEEVYEKIPGGVCLNRPFDRFTSWNAEVLDFSGVNVHYKNYEDICRQHSPAERDPLFDAIFGFALSEGVEAGKSVAPTPMGVTPVNLMGNPTGPTQRVSEGPCGFAWIDITGVKMRKVINWMKRVDLGRKGYPSGWTIWIHEFGQSHQRKEAMARRSAEVLRMFGIHAYPGSRLD